MTFKQYTLIYEVLSKLVEEMKQEEGHIKACFCNIEEGYRNDPIYKAIKQKRIALENICDSIENMEI